MIDEKKLIEEIRKRRDYWESKAAEYDEAGPKYEYLMDMCDGKASELTTILFIIDKQPRVEEWIPSDVGVPEYNEDVEITTKNGERQIGHYAGGCWYDSINGDYIQVIAWKEPSEPWKGGKE